MSELHVVATIPAKPEAVDALRVALRALVAASREEEGCLAYDLYESAAAPGTFVTMERWTGREALDVHMQSPHISDALAAADGQLSGDIAIHPLVPMS